MASQAGITRFARSQVIQNTVKREIVAYVRVAAGGKVATSATNQLDAEHLRSTTERALEVARLSLPDEEWPGAADPALVGRAEGLFRWDEDTATTSPEKRARAVVDTLAVAGSENTAGFYETSSHAYSVLTSTGIDCSDAYTRCVVNCLVDQDGATGWGEASSHRVDEVDFEAAADRARDRALRSQDPADAEPGTYEVVLEPAAVHELLEYLSYAGFGAKQMIEGESFFALRSGDKVAAENVTISDNVHDPLSVGIGFDFDGSPRKNVPLIENGVARHPVTDLRTAKRLGVGATGHASGSTAFGPYAANVVLEGGDTSREDLIGRGEARVPRHPLPLREHPRSPHRSPHRDDPGRDVRDRGRRDSAAGTQPPFLARGPRRAGIGSVGRLRPRCIGPRIRGLRLDRGPLAPDRRVPLQLRSPSLGVPGTRLRPWNLTRSGTSQCLRPPCSGPRGPS